MSFIYTNTSTGAAFGAKVAETAIHKRGSSQ